MTESKKGNVTVSVGSMTRAMQAQNLLTAATIPSSVVKVAKGSAATGCIYGVSYPRSLSAQAETVLKNNKIRFRKVVG